MCILRRRSEGLPDRWPPAGGCGCTEPTQACPAAGSQGCFCLMSLGKTANKGDPVWQPLLHLSVWFLHFNDLSTEFETYRNIIKKKKNLTYAHFKRFLWLDSSKIWDKSFTLRSGIKGQQILWHLTDIYLQPEPVNSSHNVGFKPWHTMWHVAASAHSPPRQQCSRSSSVRPCCAAA